MSRTDSSSGRPPGARLLGDCAAQRALRCASLVGAALVIAFALLRPQMDPFGLAVGAAMIAACLFAPAPRGCVPRAARARWADDD